MLKILRRAVKWMKKKTAMIDKIATMLKELLHMFTLTSNLKLILCFQLLNHVST